MIAPGSKVLIVGSALTGVVTERNGELWRVERIDGFPGCYGLFPEHMLQDEEQFNEGDVVHLKGAITAVREGSCRVAVFGSAMEGWVETYSLKK